MGCPFPSPPFTKENYSGGVPGRQPEPARRTRMVVRRMCRFWIARLIPPFDLCSEAAQALLDALIAPIDLADVLDRAGAFGC